MQNDIHKSAPHIPEPCHIPVHSIDADAFHQPVLSGRTAKHLFGKLYECIVIDAGCHTKSIQFGGMRICSWPLKEHVDGLEVHRPPCLEEKE